MMPVASPTQTSEPTRAAPGIDDGQVQFFKDNGFLALKDGLSLAEVEELRRETVRICRGEAGEVVGVNPVDADVPDADVLQQYLCIHYPNKISALMRGYVSHPAIVDVLTKIIGPNVKSMQSMLFIKSAGKPGQAWHQDEDFLPSRDRSITAAWIALDDATVDNGCLWVIPGSQRHWILWQMQDTDDARFDCTAESIGFPYTDEDAVPVEVTAGSIVFFNGYLLHRSLPNRTAHQYRRTLVSHYMSAESLLPWKLPEHGEQIAITDYRDIILVAGKDPYAYKGTRDLAQPHIRPDREGGCISWRELKAKK